MEKELFALLRLGLGNSTAEKENLSDFIVLPAAQWARLGEIAQEQGVMGVMLDGIERLEATGYGATRELSKEQKLEWIGQVMMIEQANHQQLTVVTDLQKKWAGAGLRMMVMKGQAMGTSYPNPKHRAPGDVDCYLMPDKGERLKVKGYSDVSDKRFAVSELAEAYKIGNETAKAWADKVDEGWYKHSVISYKGESIENHQYFVHTREGKKSKQLNQVLVDTLKMDEFNRLSGTEVLLPPPMFNAVFLTYHAMAHFLEEGLRIKQILDWAMLLKRDAGKVNWEEFWNICDKFHFRRFAEVMNDIVVRYLGVKGDWLLAIGYRESPYTEKVLLSTFNDKDYVFGSGKSGWANRLHIVRNLFRYRWKYKEIYQRSVFWQLWWYAVGFVFKTD